MGALQKYLPITFPTFLIGWLAISGVPPFAGFWAKGDVLANVFDHNRALWLLGLATAILTAYYMSRLFVLTFRGTERFREVTNGHDPHESPWTMTLPLVVLSIFAALGGLLDLPWIHHHDLASFLSPTFGYVAPSATLSITVQWGLGLVDAIAAGLGLLAAFSVWRTRASDARFEKEFFEHVWHWDDAYDAAIGRPLTALAGVGHDVIEAKVIDGVVEGVAGVAVRSAEGLRKTQSGFVRQYALLMSLALAVVVVFLVAKVGL
jgi:NADH-quinone oxidoreductase subunit L